MDPTVAAENTSGWPAIPDIFASVVGLVSSGANGLAAIIFVAVMIVMVFSLILGSRMTAGMISLTKWYLVLGVVCVVLAVAASIYQSTIRTPYDIYVSVSPSLESAGLPEPVIRAGTTRVKLNETFVVQANTGISLEIDDIINLVRIRDEKVVQTVEQANAIAAENNRLQTALQEQTTQLEAVRSSFETVKAGLGPTPVWADSQLNQVEEGLNSISVPASDFTEFEPITLPAEVLLSPLDAFQ